MIKYSSFFAATFLIISAFQLSSNAQDIDLSKLTLKDGLSVEIYARVKNPRQMTLGDDGTVYVGTRSKAGGRVFALLNPDNNAKADEVIEVDKGLKSPNGVTFRDGDLYVGAISTIYRYNDVAANLGKSNTPDIITDKLPTKTHHGQKFIEFGPDGLLYIPVGAPCNICEPEEDVFASLHTLDINSEDRQIKHFAKGIRNTVGFDWDPNTDELWFTDNGGDGLGDEMPAEELNHAPRAGLNFGYPYVHQGDYLDPTFGDGKDPADFTPPAQKLAPHAAALGMTFYTGGMFPAEYRNNIIIAEHGSWNRTDEAGHTGNRVTMVTLENNKAVKYETLISGWLQNNKSWGQPTDILQLEDGSFLVSDDEANAIFRVTYKN